MRRLTNLIGNTYRKNKSLGVRPPRTTTKTTKYLLISLWFDDFPHFFYQSTTLRWQISASLPNDAHISFSLFICGRLSGIRHLYLCNWFRPHTWLTIAAFQPWLFSWLHIIHNFPADDSNVFVIIFFDAVISFLK